MRTQFTKTQLTDPQNQIAEQEIRKCVHCGMCNATCPTFTILGDELDGPRGRIYLIKDMLENDHQMHQGFVVHIDRCLSCLACVTACPAGVNYSKLIDVARTRIAKQWRRPLFERWYRTLIVGVLMESQKFRLALGLLYLARPFQALLPATLRHQIATLPKHVPIVQHSRARKQVFNGHHINQDHDNMAILPEPRIRVGLLPGCVQPVLVPDINKAATQLLTSLGCEVVIAEGLGCCGALALHTGEQEVGLKKAHNNIEVWHGEKQAHKLDAIVMTASGCGSVVKDYGDLFANQKDIAVKAQQISSISVDISTFLVNWKEWSLLSNQEKIKQFLGKKDHQNIIVAYHGACSLQHGQKIKTAPQILLKQAGFEVLIPKNAHLCCGSAGTYALFQAQLSQDLKLRKMHSLYSLKPDIIVTSNIGCMKQLEKKNGIPVLHLAELLAWVYSAFEPERLMQERS